MPEEIRLLCWVYGDPVDKIFPVTIQLDLLVVHLRKAIHVKKFNEFRDIDADTLVLYKVDIDLDDFDDNSVKTLEIDEDQEMIWRKEIRSYWSQEPDGVSVVVRRPVGHQLAMELVKFSPSKMATLSEYNKLQANPKQRILNDRPQSDKDVAPIALLYEGFGKFEDTYAGKPDWIEWNISVVDLEFAVLDLADKMSETYDSDIARRDAALPRLSNIFNALKFPVRPRIIFVPTSIKDDTTDGTVIGSHSGQSLGVDIKNDITAITSLPDIRLVAQVAQFDIAAEKEEPYLYKGWRVPSLGISIVGHYIQFLAIVRLGRQYRLVGLTPLLSFVNHDDDLRARQELFRAFKGAFVLAEEIRKDILRFSDSSFPPIAESQWFLPNLQSIQQWPGTTPSVRINFSHLSRYNGDSLSHFLYRGKLSDGTKVLIKCTRQYSVELHAFCAAKGHAPQILGYEQVPGGWHIIVMEYLEDYAPLQPQALSKKQLSGFEADIIQLMNGFHGENLVHGDLRNANILVPSDKSDRPLMLVDFDWGGEVGIALYPSSRLNEELVIERPGELEDLHITKDDDIRVVQGTFHPKQK